MADITKTLELWIERTRAAQSSRRIAEDRQDVVLRTFHAALTAVTLDTEDDTLICRRCGTPSPLETGDVPTTWLLVTVRSTPIVTRAYCDVCAPAITTQLEWTIPPRPEQP
jgi:hypothetical protein